MLNVLVVDDEKDARDKMIKVINNKDKGINFVGNASDGIEAINLIRKILPDIVIIDIEMPGKSGLEVIEMATNENIDSIFIVISAYDKFIYAQDCIRLKVKDYLLKPFLPIHIFSAIYRASKEHYLLRGIKFPELMSKHIATNKSYYNNEVRSNIESLRYPYEIEEILINKLLSYSSQEVYLQLNNFFNAVKSNNKDPLNVKYCYMILYLEIIKTLIKEGFNNYLFMKKISEIFINDIDEFEGVFLYLLSEVPILANIYEIPIDNLDLIIANAIKYINKNISSELTLDIVASAIYVSPSYLSRKFSQSFSFNFTDYINSVRIDKAIHLIREQVHLNNYEIAKMVGYKSSEYFAQVFKNNTGFTVSEFKEHQFYFRYKHKDI